MKNSPSDFIVGGNANRFGCGNLSLGNAINHSGLGILGVPNRCDISHTFPRSIFFSLGVCLLKPF